MAKSNATADESDYLLKDVGGLARGWVALKGKRLAISRNMDALTLWMTNQLAKDVLNTECYAFYIHRLAEEAPQCVRMPLALRTNQVIISQCRTFVV